MRKLLAAIAATSLIAVTAHAQAPARTSPQNAAIKAPTENNSSRPVAGANSFTMEQARSQIEAKGFTKVTGLKKDGNGIWRGNAMKPGASVAVSVDYQGNVN